MNNTHHFIIASNIHYNIQVVDNTLMSTTTVIVEQYIDT